MSETFREPDVLSPCGRLSAQVWMPLRLRLPNFETGPYFAPVPRFATGPTFATGPLLATDPYIQ